jgi:probable phosphoglycerate mutase
MNAALPEVHLVRHGETLWTIEGRHTGAADVPLTERGEREARALASLLPGPYARVFTSPLRRARQTAELAGFGARAEDDADLVEWDYGEYEGRRTAEIRAERPGWNLFADGCPGGESLAEVSARAERAIARVRAETGNVLLFAHRDLLRVFAVRWIGLPAEAAERLFLATAALSVVGSYRSPAEPVIRAWNRTVSFG